MLFLYMTLLSGILGAASPVGDVGNSTNHPISADDSMLSTFLVLDDRVIRDTDNARLVLGPVKKHPKNPLFGEDKPWEVRFDNLYANVFFDSASQEYRCWYSPFIIDERTSSTPPDQRGSVKYIDVKPNGREMGVCYAASKDGLAWTKPELGLVEFDGSTRNNLVMRGPHGAGLFRDSHDPDPAKRFKMLFRDEHDMAVAYSRDGMAWSTPIACPEIAAAGDTHNNALWDPEHKEYTGFTRLWSAERKVRQVGWSHSSDFEHWSKGETVLEGIDPAQQVYAMPVFHCANVYLGLPAIFDTPSDRVHTELAWSPDTKEWHRVCAGTPFIANSETPGDYDWGCVYAAAYPVLGPDEVRIYYGGSDGPHTGWRKGYLCLATLRPNGFAGYEAADPGKTGHVITVPFSFSGRLWIDADIEDGGSVEVAVLDDGGAELMRYAPVTETATSREVAVLNGKTAKPLQGRLRFSLTKARLYAFTVETQGR